MVRAYTSRICGADIANIRDIPAEIGGGFGGKTIIYLEPLAYMLSKKSGRPVKFVMSREEVFRATGPTSGAVVEVKLGAKRDGRIIAAQSILKYQAGAFPGSPVQQGCICGMAVYDFPNALTVGYDVMRSEEHTSELQSRRDLVCRLLLEKKKIRIAAGDHGFWRRGGVDGLLHAAACGL